tara:strand:+ start:1217 stop:2800 length:1584 start_codon:yes stop_codon:yes gene_type:complete
MEGGSMFGSGSGISQTTDLGPRNLGTPSLAGNLLGGIGRLGGPRFQTFPTRFGLDQYGQAVNQDINQLVQSAVDLEDRDSIDDFLNTIEDAAAREFFLRVMNERRQGGEISNIYELLGAAALYPEYDVHRDKIPDLVRSDSNVGQEDDVAEPPTRVGLPEFPGDIPFRREPGIFRDSDGDGVPDIIDEDPSDPEKNGIKRLPGGDNAPSDGGETPESGDGTPESGDGTPESGGGILIRPVNGLCPPGTISTGDIPGVGEFCIPIGPFPSVPDGGSSPENGGETPESGGETPENGGETPENGEGPNEEQSEGTPKPDSNGNCPPGFRGVDTNGDGINDICVPEGMGILDLLRLGLGMAGSGPRGRNESDLKTAAGKAGLQVFNDPTNFMRFAPSPLQMIDPRYYNITSFVPAGEQRDFNMGAQRLPGQLYANRAPQEARTAAQGGLMQLAAGGFPRKNGQIAGPGTETSDDIPAMLSDGEFVVNAKAVRGIGKLAGKKPKNALDARREGAKAMYALQRAGERAAGLRR